MKQQTKLTPEKLASMFYGTEQHHYNPFYPCMRYTDGVQHLAEAAGCYWLLDIIGTEIYPLQKKEPFISIKVEVAHGKAVITADNGDGPDYRFFTRNIAYTDMPTGLWKFWVTNDVLMLPSEY